MHNAPFSSWIVIPNYVTDISIPENKPKSNTSTSISFAGHLHLRGHMDFFFFLLIHYKLKGIEKPVNVSKKGWQVSFKTWLIAVELRSVLKKKWPFIQVNLNYVENETMK